ncbi:MAG: helix-turn-helix transcriptional regulator [bacterium]|nr:helix-turn-helix transcriptional regulator [bacterium]
MKTSNFGEKLRALRILAGYTQREVGQFLNRSESLISYVESGERSLEAEDIIKLAKFFKVRPEYFFDARSKTAASTFFRAEKGSEFSDSSVEDFKNYVRDEIDKEETNE